MGRAGGELDPGPRARRSRLVLEYDGSAFAGWARQPRQRTVQEEVERALAVLLRVDSAALTVAGRTDAGVHAWGQVASYSGSTAPVSGLNALLPSDVVVLSCEPADDGFDARRDATSRAYCYRILARPTRSALLGGRALQWPHLVDVGLLNECASALTGTHDFTAFTPTETDHVRFERQVHAAFWRDRRDGDAGDAGASAPIIAESGFRGWPPALGGMLEFWIEADAFMRHMNRVLVGTMLEVAGGRRSLEQFVALLGGRPRAEAGPTAPACGLYLAGVGYHGWRVLAE